MKHAWKGFAGLAYGAVSINPAKDSAYRFQSIVCAARKAFHFGSAQGLSVFEF
ncbi:hypothetical protein [Pedobacter sp. FW305-3-2-15-E-R2A2]|jgi:hypothetical protein|uniref:hypothetical protein n=1 Tax=Pedobacter sp. FW305-3-2-15-E-R2A2 TaxID=3140251 RepID=UPI003140AD9B